MFFHFEKDKWGLRRKYSRSGKKIKTSLFILLSTRLFEFWLRRKYSRSGKKIKTSLFILLSTRLFEFWLRRKYSRSGKKTKNFVFYFAFHSLIRTFATGTNH